MRTILIVISALLCAAHMQARRVYYDSPAMTSGHKYIVPIDSAPAYFAIEARCAMPLNRASRRALCGWRLVWDYAGNGDYRYAQFAVDYRHYADGIDSPVGLVTIGRVTDGTDETESSVELSSGVNFDIGYNSMAVEWRNGVTVVSVGSNRLKDAGSIPCPAPANRLCGIIATDSLTVATVIAESEIPPSRSLHTEWTRDDIMAYVSQSTDSIEGIWRHLDRENDPTKARMGGNYTVATIWNPDSRAYDVIYLGGATVNPQEWIPGMIKGHLRPTIFRDHFDLIWYDSMCRPIDRDCNASISQPAILELNFPLMDTRIRLSRQYGQ